MSGSGAEVCVKFSKGCYSYDRNEIEPDSPDSPLVKNEHGELVRAPKMDSFDYPEITVINSKQLVDFVNKVFVKNRKIPKNVRQEDV